MLLAKHRAFTNERGNAVKTFAALVTGNRYPLDFNLHASGTAWQEYDTFQDASYFFGIWVNIKERKIAAYAEGNVTLIIAPDDEHLKAELKAIEKYYGPAPATFRASGNEGSRSCIGDERTAASPEP